MDSSLSASDVALLGGGNGWGNNGFEWLIGLILIGSIAGGNGLFGGNGRGNVATTEDLASGFNFSALQSKGNETLAAVNNVNQVLGNAICQLGYQIAQQFSGLERQFADCCCQILRGIDSVKFDIANYSAATNQAIAAGIQSVKDMFRDYQEQNMRDENMRNYIQSQFCGIPKTSPFAYGIYPYPTCNPCWTQQNGSY